MIIKILPIKTFAGIARVAKYIATDKGAITDYRAGGIFHNIFSTDLNKIITEFKINFTEYASAKVKNKALHCILSTSPADKDKMNAGIMEDLVNTFIEKGYSNALIFGQYHKETQHIHTHLLISGNELYSNKSTRISKRKLKSLHFEVLKYMRVKYPELTVSFSEKNYGKKTFSEREYYVKKRNPDLVLTKEILKEKVKKIYYQSLSVQSMINLLLKEGLPTYTFKGKLYGVIAPDKHKYRFSRLGLSQEKIEELNRYEKRMNELENIRHRNVRHHAIEWEKFEPE